MGIFELNPVGTTSALGREIRLRRIMGTDGRLMTLQLDELTGGLGVRAVLEAVGHMPAYVQSVAIARSGGVISRVGVPPVAGTVYIPVVSQKTIVLPSELQEARRNGPPSLQIREGAPPCAGTFTRSRPNGPTE